MITSAGKDIIKRYFGGQVSRIGGTIALGVGTTAPDLTNTKLAYESIRIPVSSVSADLANDRIVFKGTVPAGSMGTVYEIGLFDNPTTASRTKVLSLVSQTRGIWTNSTIVPDNARSETKTVKIDLVASGSKSAEITGLSQDLSAFTGTDSVAIAFQATANIAAVRIRLGADDSNYYQLVYNTPAVGYNIMRANLSAATVIGTPNWGTINYLAVRPTATAAGAGSVWFDSLSIEDNNTPLDSLLVIRNVLVTPKVLDASLDSNVELSLGITV